MILSDKRIKDIMVGIFEYPHIPYWFSIDQAIKIIKASFINTKTYPCPLAILVFDEKYNLLGTLTPDDILSGLGPRFKMEIREKAQMLDEDDATLSLDWDTLFTKESDDLLKRPIGEIMVPVKYFVEPGDSLPKAAYLMIHHDLILLPVLENRKKAIGLVRMIEVFDEITKVILKE